MDRLGSPEADAWHEAGHAVMAHLLGGEVTQVTVEDDDDAFGGRVVIRWPGDDPEASARVALAGPLTEIVRLGVERDEDVTLAAAWEADWAEVERAAAALEPDPERRTPLIEGWIAAVRRDLEQDRVMDLIARVADAVDAHGTLDEALFSDCVDP